MSYALTRPSDAMGCSMSYDRSTRPDSDALARTSRRTTESST